MAKALEKAEESYNDAAQAREGVRRNWIRPMQCHGEVMIFFFMMGWGCSGAWEVMLLESDMGLRLGFLLGTNKSQHVVIWSGIRFFGRPRTGSEQI